MRHVASSAPDFKLLYFSKTKKRTSPYDLVQDVQKNLRSIARLYPI